MPMGVDNISIPSEEVRRKTYDMAMDQHASGTGDSTAEGAKKKWRRGEMEFEALMRNLDNCVSNEINILNCAE